ncbi:MAG: hypothetical protein IJ642_02270, partial [Oscillospiraceae bacterium]|nr:hypothetical protein [Oscillospiraceae bacterium]
MKNSKLTKSAETLLNYFRTFPAGKPVTATQGELAKALNCGLNTIKRGLKQLEELEYIRIESGKEHGNQNLYFLNFSTPLKNGLPETNVLSENGLPETNVLSENGLPETNVLSENGLP